MNKNAIILTSLLLATGAAYITIRKFNKRVEQETEKELQELKERLRDSIKDTEDNISSTWIDHDLLIDEFYKQFQQLDKGEKKAVLKQINGFI